MLDSKKAIFRLLKFLILLSIIGVAIFICTTYKSNNSILKITSEIQSKQPIFPVLYFEENIVNENYDTHTYLIDGTTYKEMPKHYRTYSKTYPLDSLNIFDNSEPIKENFGQLLNYYNCLGRTSYVFDLSQSISGAREYLITDGNHKTIISYAENEYFYDFLYFGENYYLFCYAKTAPDLSDYDEIRIYKFTETFKLENRFEVNFSSINLLPYNFIDNSVAIANNMILFPVKTDDYYILKYDMSTKQLDLIKSDYGILGIIADLNSFYIIGFSNNDTLIFENVTNEIISINKNEIYLPAIVQLSQENIYFDKILYMYGSEIYCCFTFGDRYCFLSYDIDTNKWKNLWIIENTNSLARLMDVKFMHQKENKFFDMFPNWNNAIQERSIYEKN